MQGWIDMHCHVLPGLDDGAKDIDTSLQILEMAYKEGIRGIIATPHYHGGHYEATSETIGNKYEILKTIASVKYKDLQIYTGNEIYYYQSVTDWLNDGQVLSLAGSHYVLLEFSPSVEYRELELATRNVSGNGYLPILAHIERYRCLTKHIDKVQNLIDMGAYIQINTEALLGEVGFTIKQYVKKLCKYDMVDFIATDTHSVHRRRPCMKECAEYLTKHFGEAYTEKILYTNPYNVITDEYIERS